ncbi:MAG: hypothetical protein CVU22_09605 [Betaproteobacteria bacterium HGW-Betaproteobacteria-16]|nr:MAG: hypothetical protein CVU22_09605 [Betaproteobacteria bacterium HGW-Betaproteobacteria-16]
MNKEKQFEIAAAAVEELEKQHHDFMAIFEALEEPMLNGAEFQIVDGELEVTCLGKFLKANHRLIAVDGYLDCLEYPFIAKEQCEDVHVWSMFLKGRRLYRDSETKDLIWDTSDRYTPRLVAADLASKLLASRIFSPK